MMLGICPRRALFSLQRACSTTATATATTFPRSVAPFRSQLITRKAAPSLVALIRPISSFRPSQPLSSAAPAPTTNPAAPSPGPTVSRITRNDYRKQLLRVQQELALLRRRLPPLPKPSRRNLALSLLILATALVLLYKFVSPFRRLVIAAERCSRMGYAVFRCIIDYKILFRGKWEATPEGKAERHEAYENCHRKCAIRIREVLRTNGGIYIKLGQHLSSVQLIPLPWSQEMRPLQDQCQPTPLVELQALFLSDVGAPLSTFFSSFDPTPIGVASLAQVHRATLRETGQQVAVKVMHPDLEEFSEVDMKTTTLMLKIVKSVFPSFEFTWLGEEMEENLPLEMDFRHEAANAARCAADFASLKTTTLVVPQVIWAKKRAMVMEFIEGARIDDLRYLAEHQIDRNQVSKQLQHIFSRMIYVTGFFHADPHGGNLLIRPSQPGSRSPYNFEIVLLDHGLYFDMAPELRVNYAKLWLSLISPSSTTVEADRRKYAYLVGNIDDSLYPIFQAAITGRAALDDPYAAVQADGGVAPEGTKLPEKRRSVLELGEHTEQEQRRMRHAIVQTEGLMLSLFDLLRRVPRRLLMVLKVNDLARALDNSLHTTHGPSRIFLIVAHYCNLSIYISDLASLSHTYRTSGLSFSLVRQSIAVWWRFELWNVSLGVAAAWADASAKVMKWRLWARGMRKEGWKRAWEEQAGLAV